MNLINATQYYVIEKSIMSMREEREIKPAFHRVATTNTLNIVVASRAFDPSH